MKIYNYEELKRLPKKWVAVADALPPIGEEVVVFIKIEPEAKRNSVTALARYIKYEGATNHYWDNDYAHGNTHTQDAVIMWQPMPNAPNT